MNELIKNLGVIVLIIGAAVLAVPFFTGGMTNSILLTGLGLVLLGYFSRLITPFSANMETTASK